MAEGSFVRVAHVEEVPPGTVKAVHAGDEAIALANVDGGFYATQNACLHLEGLPDEGSLEKCLLTCPWHGWQYDVRTGVNDFDLAIKLRTYDVQVAHGEILVRT
jgi:nitrite reductase (NADH) small subunit